MKVDSLEELTWFFMLVDSALRHGIIGPLYKRFGRDRINVLLKMKYMMDDDFSERVRAMDTTIPEFLEPFMRLKYLKRPCELPLPDEDDD